MSKIRHFIHKVMPATSSKRGFFKSTVSKEAAAEVADHRNVVEFAGENGEVHLPPQDGDGHHNHGRRRDRNLSLTEEKVLRSEAREATEERERQKHDAERKEAYDEVCFSSHFLLSSHQPILHSGSSERILRRQTVYKPEIRCDALLIGRRNLHASHS